MNFFKKKPTFLSEIEQFKKLVSVISKFRFIRFLFYVVIAGLLAPLVVFVIFKPVKTTSINYGVNFSSKYAKQLGLDWQKTYLAVLNELKPEYMRLAIYWDEIEIQNDVFDFSEVDWQLKEAQKNEIKVILAIGRRVPRYPECHEPDWWKKIENRDIKEFELLNYTKEIVLRYKDNPSIVMWQIENEPFFPFGTCEYTMSNAELNREIALVKSLDDRPISMQDSGEGGLWRPLYDKGDRLGISMYRKVWFDFWGILINSKIYIKYPIASWGYKIKANLLGIDFNNIMVTELQAEPWGPKINSKLTQEQKDKTMSRTDFLDTIAYAQNSGVKDIYFWGVEWWYWEREYNNNSFFWDTGQSVISHSK